MINMCVKTRENIEFKFEGNNEIDARDFSKFLNETVNLFQTIVNLSDKDVELKLNINTFEKGSFNIKATTVIEIGKKLFEKIKGASEVVSALKDVVEIKNMLKKEIPEKVDKENGRIYLKNQTIHNENALILNIFGDERNMEIIDKAINKFTQSIPKNRNLNITDKNGSFKIDDEIKENLSQEFIKNDESTFETENVERRNLIIKKPDLTMKSQWEFISDKVVKANIVDEEFKEKVLKREFTVYHNKKVDVLLKTKVKISENSNIIDTHYEIIKVFLEDDEIQMKLK